MDILTNAIAMLVSAGEHGRILLILFVILLAAKLMAELFERLRQPAVVGEILAGVLLGPSLLNLINPSPDAGGIAVVIEALAEIGVIFLLFTVGLETRPSDIFRVGRMATLVGIMGSSFHS